MQRWEYKVVAAPTKGIKAKGVKSPEDRFALAVETAINAMAADGWHYHRTDMLPATERAGLTGSATQWRNLLVFKRPVEAGATPQVIDVMEPPVLPEKDEPPLTAPPKPDTEADEDTPRA